MTKKNYNNKLSIAYLILSQNIKKFIMVNQLNNAKKDVIWNLDLALVDYGFKQHLLFV